MLELDGNDNRNKCVLSAKCHHALLQTNSWMDNVNAAIFCSVYNTLCCKTGNVHVHNCCICCQFADYFAYINYDICRD